MSNLLYHAYLPENREHHVSLEEVMSCGIKYSTKSNNVYSNSGREKFEITELLRPSNTPDWVNFKESIGVDITNRFSKSFSFPIFTDKILVFDGYISLSISSQEYYEDMYDFDEEAFYFNTGETIEYWIKQYWKSMMTLEDYLIKKPYLKPEVLIFESVPKEIIQIHVEKIEPVDFSLIFGSKTHDGKIK